MKKILLLVALLALFGCGKRNYYDYTLKNDDTYKISLKENVEKKKLEIPSTYNKKKVTEIDDFRLNDYVVEVVIPKTVTDINEIAFEKCQKLEKITVSSNNQVYSSVSGNLYTKDKKELLRYACGKKSQFFTSLSNVEIIGNRAFNYAGNLTEVKLTNVIEIKKGAFNYCGNLKTVKLGKSVQRFQEAFNYCTKITDFIVEEENENMASFLGSIYSKDKKTLYQYAIGRIEEISINCEVLAGKAFSTCQAEAITIGPNVTQIEETVFSECANLRNMYIRSEAISESFSSDLSYIGNIENIFIEQNMKVGEYILESYVNNGQTTHDGISYTWFKYESI